MRFVLLCILLFISTVLSAQLWVPSRIADMPMPISNNAVTGAFANGQYYIYSFGGIDTSKKYSGIVQSAYKWNESTDTWSSLPPLPDTLGKIASAASAVKGKIYIIGGYHVYSNGSEKSSSRVHIFDPSTDTYLADGAPIPVPIDDQVQSVWRDSLIYVITGWSDVGNVGDVQIYNPSQDTWMSGTAVPNGNYQVFGSQGFIRNDTIYYYGGASNGVNFPATAILRRGVIDSLNPSVINWLPFTLYNNHPLYRMIGLPNPNGQIAFLGGSSISYNYDGISYASNQGVSPAHEQIVFDVASQTFGSDYTYDFPMDLRGCADKSSTMKFICGGMRDSQQVSNWAYRLDYMQGVGTTNWAKEVDLKIYPNPAGEVLHIDFDASGEMLNLRLMNTLGEIMHSETSNQSMLINLSNLPKGTYFLVFSVNEKEYVESVVKK